MNDKAIQKFDINDWRTRVLIIGGALGLLVGAGAAYLYIQQNADREDPPDFTAGDGLKLALLVMGLVRSVADIGQQ